MYLYLLSQKENCDYDTYDSCVVCAGSEEEARNIYPGQLGDENPWNLWKDWASSTENVSVKLIGKALDGIEKGVICASFNAG